MPGNSNIIYNDDDPNIKSLLSMGCWANKQCFKRIESISNIFGEHNLKNASASIAAAKLIGISEFDSIKALEKFSGVKRRLELVENKKIYFI